MSKLPQLPKAAYLRLSDLQSGIDSWYSERQMQAYGQQCRDAALDGAEAACITTADPRATPYADGYNMGAIDCTKAIRSLK
jgi:hypothetical protein